MGSLRLLDELSWMAIVSYKDIIQMKKGYLYSYITCAIIGGTAFWGSFAIVTFIIGSNYGGKTVGFLTLFTPITIWLLIWLWYNTILPPGKKGISSAITIGIVGPFIMTWLYSLVSLIIPAVSMSPIDEASDILTLVGISIVIGPLSVLTYTGMLGAMMLNVIGTLFIGYWLSKQLK